MPSLKELKGWLTTSEAASKLGKSRQGVVWLCENGRIRAVRTRLGWLVDPKAVQDQARKEGK
jgi:excisionase family DNA binding protein